MAKKAGEKQDRVVNFIAERIVKSSVKLLKARIAVIGMEGCKKQLLSRLMDFGAVD